MSPSAGCAFNGASSMTASMGSSARKAGPEKRTLSGMNSLITSSALLSLSASSSPSSSSSSSHSSLFDVSAVAAHRLVLMLTHLCAGESPPHSRLPHPTPLYIQPTTHTTPPPHHHHTTTTPPPPHHHHHHTPHHHTTPHHHATPTHLHTTGDVLFVNLLLQPRDEQGALLPAAQEDLQTVQTGDAKDQKFKAIVSTELPGGVGVEGGSSTTSASSAHPISPTTPPISPPAYTAKGESDAFLLRSDGSSNSLLEAIVILFSKHSFSTDVADLGLLSHLIEVWGI
jgi:hypothetical protein